MTYLTFDRLKIKANYKYLLERQIQFNQRYNPDNGDLIGQYYSSENDKLVPFNLFIAVSKPKQTLTLEFSSKILGEDYPKLISKYTIRQCLENINKLGICRIDVDGILQTGCITSADVTNDVLNAEANPILTMYDRVFGHTSDVPEIQADTFDDFAMQKILNAYHGDIKTIEMTLKPLYASRSGFDKRMTKIRQTWEKMLNSTSGGINYVNSVRNLLV